MRYGLRPYEDPYKHIPSELTGGTLFKFRDSDSVLIKTLDENMAVKLDNGAFVYLDSFSKKVAVVVPDCDVVLFKVK